jgi:nicotinamide mononucleotide (NMN) deamidase PncC
MKTFPLIFAVALIAAVVAGAIGYNLGHDAASQSLAKVHSKELESRDAALSEAKTQVAAERSRADEQADQLVASSSSGGGDRGGREGNPLGDVFPSQEEIENMPIENRRAMRRAFFSALANAEGLEELGEAMRTGQLNNIDPSQLNIDPEIGDRVRFFAETQDTEGARREIQRTIENLARQVRGQAGDSSQTPE